MRAIQTMLLMDERRQNRPSRLLASSSVFCCVGGVCVRHDVERTSLVAQLRRKQPDQAKESKQTNKQATTATTTTPRPVAFSSVYRFSLPPLLCIRTGATELRSYCTCRHCSRYTD